MNRQHMIAEMRRRAWERHQQALLAHRHIQYPHRAPDENVIFYGGAPPSISGVGALHALGHHPHTLSDAALERQRRFGNTYAAAELARRAHAAPVSTQPNLMAMADGNVFFGSQGQVYQKWSGAFGPYYVDISRTYSGPRILGY